MALVEHQRAYPSRALHLPDVTRGRASAPPLLLLATAFPASRAPLAVPLQHHGPQPDQALSPPRARTSAGAPSTSHTNTHPSPLIHPAACSRRRQLRREKRKSKISANPFLMQDSQEKVEAAKARVGRPARGLSAPP